MTFQAFNEKVGKRLKKLMKSAVLVKMKTSVLEDSTLSECKGVALNIWRILLQWMSYRLLVILSHHKEAKIE